MAAVAARRNTVESLLGRAESWLLGSTALSPKSPFVFGVAKARQVAPKAKLTPTSVIMQAVGFGIGEARERIKEFLNGTFKPGNLSEMFGYLSERAMRLETRRSRDGALANYLVDLHTQRSVMASAVDRRLSRPGIARMFGRSIEAEAEAVRRRIARTPEQVLARALRDQNAGRLLAADNAITPFEDWDDVVFSAPSMFDGREVAMQGDELWVGNVLALASEDPAENLRIMEKAASRGQALLFPARTKADADAGRLTPGMPILLREGAVRMQVIDQRLSSEALNEVFGMSLHDRYYGMQKQYSSKMKDMRNGREADVIDLDAFRQQFGRRAPVVQVQEAPAPIPASVRAASSRMEEVRREAPAQPTAPTRRGTIDHAIRHEVGDDGRERMIVVDRRTGAETMFDPIRLQPGRYPKEDGFGLPAGYLVVDSDGAYMHLDADDRFHNAMGPAIVPAPGTNEPVRYAIDGEFRSMPVGHYQPADELERAPSYRR